MKSSKPHSATCGCHGTDGKPLSRDEFRNKLCKLVRANYVADGSNHWRFKKVVPNELRKT